MKLLVQGKNIVVHAYNIEWGLYHEPFELWKATDENGELVCYAVDYDYQLIENVELPSDYEVGKYFYENGGFVLNEDWKPYVSIEEKVAMLEEQLANLSGDAVWDEIAVAIEEGVNEV